MEKQGKIWAGWLRCRYKWIVLYLVICGVYGLVCWLYGLGPGGAAYGFCLTAVIFTVYLLVDYFHFRKKHMRIREMASWERIFPETFPEAEDLLDTDYQKVIKNLCRQIDKLENESEKNQREMLEYYTMWGHQIKTPIAGMRLLLQQQELPEGRELELELLRIEQYVQMVLSYLRLKDMSSDLQIQNYDLDGIIRQAVKSHSRFFIGKRLRLEYEPVNRKVLTDEKWLEFVLEQVISNAVKYTPRQGCIRIEMEEPDVLVIRDTGIGIRKEDLPMVFQRGFTGFNGREQKRATGLGLFLCREICEKLSHKITISSEPGKGTSVFIDLRMMDLKMY
ncbi:MAG: sensor histidine kinase [Clostridiales bacterium]|nr:sensor histidine kinase [Clostridiales bacterium]